MCYLFLKKVGFPFVNDTAFGVEISFHKKEVIAYMAITSFYTYAFVYHIVLSFNETCGRTCRTVCRVGIR